jgi:signal transduction histidine kinase
MPLRNPLRFFVELVRQPVWIPIWVLFLMIVNVASIGFWHEPVAQLIFASFLMSAMLMMGLYSRFGFEEILGLGHIPWIPVLVYVLTQISAAEAAFKSYLLVLSVSIAISLVFDTIDVWKYFKKRGGT